MKKITLASLFSISILAGCAAPISNNYTYNANDVGVEQSVKEGIVESVRPIVLDRGRTGVGLGTGALLGGLVGSQIGKGNGAIAGAVVGAVGGGIAGQAIEGRNSKTEGIEITVRLRNGPLVVVSQTADEQFYPRDRVRLITSNGKTRVVH